MLLLIILLIFLGFIFPYLAYLIIALCVQNGKMPKEALTIFPKAFRINQINILNNK